MRSRPVSKGLGSSGILLEPTVSNRPDCEGPGMRRWPDSKGPGVRGISLEAAANAGQTPAGVGAHGPDGDGQLTSNGAFTQTVDEPRVEALPLPFGQISHGVSNLGDEIGAVHSLTQVGGIRQDVVLRMPLLATYSAQMHETAVEHRSSQIRYQPRQPIEFAPANEDIFENALHHFLR